MTHLFYTPTLATEDLAVSRVTSAPGITDGHTHKGMRVHAHTQLSSLSLLFNILKLQHTGYSKPAGRPRGYRGTACPLRMEPGEKTAGQCYRSDDGVGGGAEMASQAPYHWLHLKTNPPLLRKKTKQTKLGVLHVSQFTLLSFLSPFHPSLYFDLKFDPPASTSPELGSQMCLLPS